MLHTKFRENRPIGSGEDFLKGFSHIWALRPPCHLGHVTRIMLKKFHFLVPESFHTKFSSEWPSSF